MTADTDLIQAAAAVGSGVVAAGAVVVAWLARGVAKEANGIAESSLGIASQSVAATKRTAILASVPSVLVQAPVHVPQNQLVVVKVTNDGPSAAYGVLVWVAGARERSLEAIETATREASGRRVSLTQRQPADLRIPVGRLTSPEGNLTYQWVAVRVEYYSPLGAVVQQDYLWRTTRPNPLFRLHRMRIDPRDGTEPLVFNVQLGPLQDFEDDAER